MRAAAEIRAGIGVLLAIQLTTTFGGVALLGRITPAVDRIIEENVRTLTATEDMLSALADQGCDPTGIDVQARFDDALGRARANITEPGEEELIRRVEQRWPAAFGGDCNARTELRSAIQGLAEANRASMRHEDELAKALGNGGAWATALLGLCAFATSAALITRFTRRISAPLVEIEQMLDAVVHGDPYRRVRRLPAPDEFHAIAIRINQLLDRRQAKEEAEDPQLVVLDRALLHHLLDKMPEPTVAVDTSGAIIAASDAAMDLLAGPGVSSLTNAIAPGLSDTPSDDETSLIQRVEPFGKGAGFLITLRPGASPAPSPSHGEATEEVVVPMDPPPRSEPSDDER